MCVCGCVYVRVWMCVCGCVWTCVCVDQQHTSPLPPPSKRGRFGVPVAPSEEDSMDSAGTGQGAGPRAGPGQQDDDDEDESGGAASLQGSDSKVVQQTRRLLANARERTRVHTISAAFEALRQQVPCYSYGQKLSKLAILRIACSYILALAKLANEDYSGEPGGLSFSECVEQCTRTLQAEGRAKKRKAPRDSPEQHSALLAPSAQSSSTGAAAASVPRNESGGRAVLCKRHSQRDERAGDWAQGRPLVEADPAVDHGSCAAALLLAALIEAVHRRVGRGVACCCLLLRARREPLQHGGGRPTDVQSASGATGRGSGAVEVAGSARKHATSAGGGGGVAAVVPGGRAGFPLATQQQQQRGVQEALTRRKQLRPGKKSRALSLPLAVLLAKGTASSSHWATGRLTSARVCPVPLFVVVELRR
ncbi:unnamed protein product [Lampetra planeri]